jgi:hypothetical protein
MKYITSFILFTLLIIGCRNQKATSISDTTSVALSDSSVIISFEQTACYGTCPVHKVTVLKNGFATYHGERHVAQIGDYDATLSKEQINDIYTKASELDFFNLDSVYTANMTDLPTTLIQINTGKQNNSVSAYGNYPENLQKFIAFLGRDLQKVVWTKKK